jgi:hypothetical protein
LVLLKHSGFRINGENVRMKNLVSFIHLLSLRCRTPRSSFAGNKIYVDACNTDPFIRGVQFLPLTLTSFRTSKARGVLHHAARPALTIFTVVPYTM